MIIFNTDLDNTIIYSYKREIGPDKKCVEWYEGREVSYITKKTEQLLMKVKDVCILVPTTTRTTEQYNRLQLGIGVPEYALTCNGGVLLHHGEFQKDWYQESLERIQDCKGELVRAAEWLEQDTERSLDVRYIEKLFVFTKSRQPEKTIRQLKGQLDAALVDVFSNGVKIYVVPKRLNKGQAILRLREKLKSDYVIAAGDSVFDSTMLNLADMGIAHPELFAQKQFGEHVITTEGTGVFSEELLEFVLRKCRQ